MTCQEYLTLLEKQLDGLTTPDEDARLGEHEQFAHYFMRERRHL